MGVVLAALATACAAGRPQPSGPAEPPVPDRGDFGVLVMAHGGTPEWNQGVLTTLEPLLDQLPIEVAFGMADAATLENAVQRLERRGVENIGVVRLFISGESWYARTRQILGLVSGAPARPAEAGPDGGVGGHGMEFWRIETRAAFALTTQGLAEAEGMGSVLADRARDLSRDPTREDVLILAHGPGDDAENERWLAHIDARAQAVRDSLPFRRVRVMTLREDWPDRRERAELEIRGFVENAARDGAAIVIPFRVYGFGPYARVLDGLQYVSDGRGLIPHPEVTRWIADQIELLRRGPFHEPPPR